MIYAEWFQDTKLKMNTIELTNNIYQGEVFSGQKVSRFSALNCRFVNCKFENMDIKDAVFGLGNKKTQYIGCSFDNSKLSSKVPGVARFENCSFKNVTIKELFCVDVDIVNCSFSGKIKSGNIVGEGSDIDKGKFKNEIVNNDFSALNLDDVGFQGIDLKAQKFPSCDRYAVLTDVTGFIKEMEASELLRNTNSDAIKKVLNILEMENQGGNNQLLVDKNSFPVSLVKAVDILF